MVRPILTILFFPLSLAFLLPISAGKPVFKPGIKQSHPLYSVRQVKAIKAEFPGPGNALGAYLHNNVLIPEIAFKMKGKNEVVMGGSIEVEIKADGSARFIQLKNLNVLPNTPRLFLCRNTTKIPRRGQSFAGLFTEQFNIPAREPGK